MRVVVVEYINILIIIRVVLIDYRAAHFCPTVWLELLCSGIFIFAPQRDGPANRDFLLSCRFSYTPVHSI